MACREFDYCGPEIILSGVDEILNNPIISSHRIFKIPSSIICRENCNTWAVKLKQVFIMLASDEFL